MSSAIRDTTLTPEQESYVWSIVCLRMDEDDRNPLDVIEENYGGDRSRYLRDMAIWHEIKFGDGGSGN